MNPNALNSRMGRARQPLDKAVKKADVTAGVRRVTSKVAAPKAPGPPKAPRGR